jgi:hypothetical protein
MILLVQISSTDRQLSLQVRSLPMMRHLEMKKNSKGSLQNNKLRQTANMQTAKVKTLSHTSKPSESRI